jgi:hypothetical protein
VIGPSVVDHNVLYSRNTGTNGSDILQPAEETAFAAGPRHDEKGEGCSALEHERENRNVGSGHVCFWAVNRELPPLRGKSTARAEPTENPA